MTHGLEWPSLTIQFFPSIKKLGDGQKISAVGGISKNVAEQHEFLLGTHTTGEQNYLMVGSVNLPKDDAVVPNNNGEDEDDEGPNNKKQKTEEVTPVTNYNPEKNELGGHTPTSDLVGKIEIKMKIPHSGEVNRARYMPSNHFVVATRGPSEEVYIWDLSKHESFSTEATPAPQLVLRGHTGEGYGLAWCGVPGEENEGRLATCADDKTVMIWDVKKALAEGKNGMEVNPTVTLRYHSDVVEDVDWHAKDANMVGSCGDDRRVCLWDVRKGSNDKPVHVVEKAHGGDINCIEFHPTNEFMLATGGSDEVVTIWDMRNLKR
jgi:histone-binding protein RBBP4